MERKTLCTALVTVLLLSTSFIAGCTDPFSTGNNRRYCPECGCHYTGTLIEPEGQQAQFTLTGSDIAHAKEFINTDFRLTFVKTDYRLHFESSIPANNSTPQTLNYKIEFDGPTDMNPSFKLPERVWTNYSIELHTMSTDSYLKNRTYFNGSNSIKGKLWNDQDGDILNVTVDPPILGVSIEKTGPGRNRLMVNTIEWSFGIDIDSWVICSD
jgi:hypothetical protein